MADQKTSLLINRQVPEFVREEHPNFIALWKVKAMRTLSTIAYEISKDWKKPYFGAVPYIQAMSTLGDIKQPYGYDSGESIVEFFIIKIKNNVIIN